MKIINSGFEIGDKIKHTKEYIECCTNKNYNASDIFIVYDVLFSRGYEKLTICFQDSWAIKNNKHYSVDISYDRKFYQKVNYKYFQEKVFEKVN